MLEWLRDQGQSDAAIERVWRTVLVSALDEELDRASARYGLDVFWKAFLRNRRGFEIGIPRVPLGDLYSGCREAIEKRGGKVRTRTSVRALRMKSRPLGELGATGGEARMAAAVLDDGVELTADVFLSALPHDALLSLLPGEMATGDPVFARLRELRTSPITGVHLWLDRVVTEEPCVALLDRTTQWVFNKTALYSAQDSSASNAPSVVGSRGPAVPSAPRGQAQGTAAQYLQLVISASYNLVEKPRQEIVDLCWKEIQEVFPAARQANLVKSTVVKEVNATFSPAPGCDRLRPGAHSPIKNLYLAGDWTDTGWPSTMEGAVRSGYLAAEAILADTGQPQKLLRDDLPAEGFSRRAGSR